MHPHSISSKNDYSHLKSLFYGTFVLKLILGMITSRETFQMQSEQHNNTTNFLKSYIVWHYICSVLLDA